MGKVADEFTDRLHRGERPQITEYTEQHPDIAEALRGVLCALQWMGGSSESLSNSAAGSSEPMAADVQQNLGDYRLIRELGRGGMGIVYEAEQLSLSRKVALKILPFASVLDPRQLQRFKNEARAAAALHHPNVVPVYGIGCEHSVHFYVMQYIKGQTLADVIAELSNNPLRGRGSEDRDQHDVVWQRESVSNANAQPVCPSIRSIEWFRRVAQLGIDVAEALDHAHSVGVIHRDIKPSNLIQDEEGKVWVTDFGLAQIESDASLTMTGAVLGTLRYMSPEQAIGKRGIVDHRTDIYSLGVSLYELITLCPAMHGDSRADLIRNVVETDPTPPRRLNPSVPRDLENVLLKAIAKRPSDRYVRAREFADDLQRWLTGKTILARRPTSVERLGKWSQRHQSLVATCLVAVLLLALVSTSAAVVVWQKNRETDRALAVALKNSQEAKFQSSRLAVNQSLAMCRDENVAEGLIWLAHALSLCPESELNHQRVIRANIDAWIAELHSLVSVSSHRIPIHSIAFTSTGDSLLSVGEGPTVQIWEPATGQCVREFNLDPKDASLVLTCVVAQPQSRFAAVGTKAGAVILFDIESGVVQSYRQMHQGAVRRLQFLSDGRRIISASDDCSVCTWSLEDGQLIGNRWLLGGKINGLFVAQDQKTALTSTLQDNVVRQWDIERGVLIREIFAAEDRVMDFAPLNEGKKVAMTMGAFYSRIWDIESESFSEVRLRHMAPINDVDTTDDGRLIATSSHDHTTKIWHWPSGEQFGPPLGHPIGVGCVAFQPRQRKLATATVSSERPEIRFWQIKSAELPIPTIPDVAQYVRFALVAGRQFLALGKDGHVHLWDIQTGKMTKTLEGSCDLYAVSRDGTHVACMSAGTVTLYDLVRNRSVFQLHVGELFPQDLVLSPSASHLLVAGQKGALVDCSTQRLISYLAEHSAAIHTGSFSTDGNLLATAAGDQTVRIWDVGTGQSIGSPMRQPATIGSVHFLPGSNEIAVGTKVGDIGFWDLSTRKLSRGGVRLPTLYKELSFHPTRPWLLAVGGNGSAQFFDLATGQTIGKQLAHFSSTFFLGFSPDGHTVVTVGQDDQPKLWRVPQVAEGTPDQIRRRIESVTGMTLRADEKIDYFSGKPL